MKNIDEINKIEAVVLLYVLQAFKEEDDLN